MINISDINPAEIMIGAIAGQIVNVIWNFTAKKLAETEPIKKLKNIKLIKTLEFSLAYILPLGTIIFLIIENKTEPTFKNIALFIIICVSLIFNILMSHIRAIYKMFTELTTKSSDNDLVHKKAINIIFEHIGKDERIK
ncbi:hypothetical protein IWX83_003527 [Flavobacterium sp. CG_9.1]|uniref:hypothetical protein n=1 Tax=Flavobacterium sp. CG_9.1 TaxID=2787728 RepID=UPI0018C92B9F|nr:hypothetical protein [Flavobacterium sp. CG_9.1]MBG6063709.1 hypothetical protein [Flavobacterium sp. CG_9.1]